MWKQIIQNWEIEQLEEEKNKQQSDLNKKKNDSYNLNLLKTEADKSDLIDYNQLLEKTIKRINNEIIVFEKQKEAILSEMEQTKNQWEELYKTTQSINTEAKLLQIKTQIQCLEHQFDQKIKTLTDQKQYAIKIRNDIQELVSRIQNIESEIQSLTEVCNRLKGAKKDQNKEIEMQLSQMSNLESDYIKVVDACVNELHQRIIRLNKQSFKEISGKQSQIDDEKQMKLNVARAELDNIPPSGPIGDANNVVVDNDDLKKMNVKTDGANEPSFHNSIYGKGDIDAEIMMIEKTEHFQSANNQNQDTVDKSIEEKTESIYSNRNMEIQELEFIENYENDQTTSVFNEPVDKIIEDLVQTKMKTIMSDIKSIHSKFSDRQTITYEINMVNKLKEIDDKKNWLTEVMNILKKQNVETKMPTDEEFDFSSSSDESSSDEESDNVYLKLSMGKALTKALSDLNCQKPDDPTSFLSNWLRSYHFIAEQIEEKEQEHANLLAKRNNLYRELKELKRELFAQQIKKDIIRHLKKNIIQQENINFVRNIVDSIEKKNFYHFETMEFKVPILPAQKILKSSH